MFTNHQNLCIRKKIISFNKKLNLILKKNNKIFDKNVQNNTDFLDNFNKIKYKIKDEDKKKIDLWEGIKTKNNLIKKKENKIINLFEFKENTISILIKNMLFFNLLNFKNIKINNLYNKFLNIKINRINLIKNLIFYKNNSYIFIIIDLRTLKTKIITFNKNKCLHTITNGLMFKKMQLNNKKYKKSEKISYLTLKTFLLNLNSIKKYKNIFIQIKGLKKYTNNIIKYVNIKLGCYNKDKKQQKNNIIFINSIKTHNNVYFKNKKIKSIKKRLKKKFINS